MQLRKRGEAPEAEISSASMADIAFLLIIFFMVTAVFSATKGLDFKLPKDEDNNQPQDQEEAIFFKVIENGTFTMDGKLADPDDILPYVMEKLERWPDKPIIIYSRRQAPYKTMVRIYDKLVMIKKTEGWDPRKDPNISIPTFSEIQEYIAAFGYNPFEQQ